MADEYTETLDSTAMRTGCQTSSFSSEPPRSRKNTTGVHEYMIELRQQHDKDLSSTDITSVTPDERFHMPIASLSFKDVGFSIPIAVPSKRRGLVADVENGESPTPAHKVILEPCSGHYGPGKLVAIMGPSGCGKSTLLDILAGKKTSLHTGQVYLNGHKVDRNFCRLTAYVPQHDVMPAHWQVEEAIMFNQSLRIEKPSKVSWEMMRQRVKVIAADLGLDKVLSTKIGSETVRGISGGQRRRVTLARGLVTGANILFCDEPTSGLSSTDAEVCIRLMRYGCLKRGTSMFVVIHQPKPEVARLFDDLILLTCARWCRTAELRHRELCGVPFAVGLVCGF